MPGNSSKDIAGMRNSLNYLSEKVDDLIHMTNEIIEILSLVTSRQGIIMANDKQVESLENRIENL